MFKVKIDTNNVAFWESGDNRLLEIARILKEVVSRLEEGNVTKNILYDINGNPVGNFSLTRR